MSSWKDEWPGAQGGAGQPIDRRAPWKQQGETQDVNGRSHLQLSDEPLGGPDTAGLLPGPSSLFRPSQHSGSAVEDVGAMNDDQLYSLIMSMDPPPIATVPTSAEERQPPVSVEETKKAIQAAKASIGVKSSSRADQTSEGSSDDADFSPKGQPGKSKRVLANRQSAQRSRMRKLQYIQDLESNVNQLQTEVGHIQPQLTFLRDKYSGLSSQNQHLRDQVASLLNEARYKDSVNHTLKEEIGRLVNKPGSQVEVGHFAADSHEPFGITPSSLHFTAPMQQ